MRRGGQRRNEQETDETTEITENTEGRERGTERETAEVGSKPPMGDPKPPMGDPKPPMGDPTTGGFAENAEAGSPIGGDAERRGV